MHAHDQPASFHNSPQEAMRAPAEEFLYLACLRDVASGEQVTTSAVIMESPF